MTEVFRHSVKCVNTVIITRSGQGTGRYDSGGRCRMKARMWVERTVIDKEYM